MIAMGGQAPVFNLCNVSVAHSNLFCAESAGIPRVKMPQLDAQQTKDFRHYLKDKGYKIEKTDELASHLRATQNELNGAKVAKNAQRLLKDPGKPVRFLVSKITTSSMAIIAGLLRSELTPPTIAWAICRCL